MKKLILLLFYTIALNAQENEIYKPNSEIVNAEASIVFPIGNLSNKFNYAQSYGFWFKMGEQNGFAANIGLNLLFLNNARPIDYKFKDSIYTIDSKKFGFDIGVRAIKRIATSKNQKHYLELGYTLGINYLVYDFPNDETDKKEDQEQSNPFGNPTILLSPEIRYMYKNVGLKLQHKFTAYNMIKDFEHKFGSSSLSLGIVYKQ